MNKFAVISAIIIATLLTSGCSTRLGKFTVASSHNVRGLDYSIADKTKQHVTGQSCIHSVFFIPLGHFDDRIQRAMDEAIASGQTAGLDGDVLVNVRIDHNVWSVILYGQNCVSVEGDLVKIKK
ncbi:MAG: hypothetical protein PXX73_06570 [Sideroxydans sp.]|nr:hypothetical protein [Sideroxydans sp.]